MRGRKVMKGALASARIASAARACSSSQLTVTKVGGASWISPRPCASRAAAGASQRCADHLRAADHDLAARLDRAEEEPGVEALRRDLRRDPARDRDQPAAIEGETRLLLGLAHGGAQRALDARPDRPPRRRRDRPCRPGTPRGRASRPVRRVEAAAARVRPLRRAAARPWRRASAREARRSSQAISPVPRDEARGRESRTQSPSSRASAARCSEASPSSAASARARR